MSSLMDLNDDNQVIEIACDHFSKGDFTILCDGVTVCLTEQALGSAPSQEITIPKQIFDYLITKYQEPQ